MVNDKLEVVLSFYKIKKHAWVFYLLLAVTMETIGILSQNWN